MRESARLERNRKGTKRNHWWYRVYRARMRRGLERCRNRDCSRLATTFGHLIPHAHDGRFRLDNLTLLCLECNAEQGDQVWPWLTPLSEDPEHQRKMEEARSWLGADVAS